MDVESETINLVNFDACKLQSYPDSPGAGGAEVGVKLRLLLKIFVNCFFNMHYNFLQSFYVLEDGRFV